MSASRRLRTCAAVLAGVLLMAAGGATPARAGSAEPVASTLAATMPCEDLLFVGVRESGGTPPFGAVVGPIRDAVQQRWPGTMRQVYLDYPAANPHELTQAELEGLLLDVTPPSPAYLDSVAQGVAGLRAVVDDSSARCPREQVIVVGFSQGAQVITEMLSTGSRVPRLRGALQLGNPLHYPGQNVRELDGQVDTPAMGLDAMLTYLRTTAAPSPDRTREQSVLDLIRALVRLYEGSVPNAEIAGAIRSGRATLPASEYQRVFSVCLSGDLVCDAAAGLWRVLSRESTLSQEYDRARPRHLGYTLPAVDASVAAILANGPLPSPPASEPAPTGGGPATRPVAWPPPFDSPVGTLLGLAGVALLAVAVAGGLALAYRAGVRRGRRAPP